MEDEADVLSNLCADLVSLRRLEPGLANLFHRQPAGSWVAVRELYEKAGQPNPAIKPQLTAAWLPSPGDPDYAIILFYDDTTKWSLTADYNVARILGRQPTAQVAAAG